MWACRSTGVAKAGEKGPPSSQAGIYSYLLRGLFVVSLFDKVQHMLGCEMRVMEHAAAQRIMLGPKQVDQYPGRLTRGSLLLYMACSGNAHVLILGLILYCACCVAGTSSSVKNARKDSCMKLEKSRQ